MVVYYHVAMCNVEKLVYYLQRQGHIEGLYNQNMTAGPFATRFGLIVQH